MPKRTLTDQDFVNNPLLTEKGFKPGDEIEYDEKDSTDNAGLAADDDTGGSNPPSNKEG